MKHFLMWQSLDEILSSCDILLTKPFPRVTLSSRNLSSCDTSLDETFSTRDNLTNRCIFQYWKRTLSVILFYNLILSAKSQLTYAQEYTTRPKVNRFSALRWRRNEHGGVSNHQLSPLFTQPFIRVQIKVNIKAPRHWPLCGEFTGDRWIPRTNGQ